MPEDGGFALVGDAEGGNVLGRKLGGGHRPPGHAELRAPDGLGIVLDDARGGQNLFELLLRLGHDAALTAEDDRTARRRALIQGEDVLGHGSLVPPGDHGFGRFILPKIAGS